MSILAAIFGFVRAIPRRRATLALEKIALRQQLAVLRRSVQRPRLQSRDRVFLGLAALFGPGSPDAGADEVFRRDKAQRTSSTLPLSACPRNPRPY